MLQTHSVKKLYRKYLITYTSQDCILQWRDFEYLHFDLAIYRHGGCTPSQGNHDRLLSQ